MKLYLIEGCPFAHRATFMLGHKGIAFEPVFFTRGARPAALDAIGPNARSPTVVDADASVWDSLVVCEYLEDRSPERPLLPRDAAGRAAVRMIVQTVVGELFPHVGTMAGEIVYKPEAARDAAKLDAARRGFVEALARWEERLTGGPFLLGDALTLADIVLFTPVVGVSAFGVEIPAAHPQLRAWFDRMSASPGAKLLRPN